jgi:hypothetical protein
MARCSGSVGHKADSPPLCSAAYSQIARESHTNLSPIRSAGTRRDPPKPATVGAKLGESSQIIVHEKDTSLARRASHARRLQEEYLRLPTKSSMSVTPVSLRHGDEEVADLVVRIVGASAAG